MRKIICTLIISLATLFSYNTADGQLIIRTSNMIVNDAAHEGMIDLLNLMENAGIIIVSLEEALNNVSGMKNRAETVVLKIRTTNG